MINLHDMQKSYGVFILSVFQVLGGDFHGSTKVAQEVGRKAVKCFLH